MLSLALRNKIAITEDVLTAAFFDALADRRDVAMLGAILAMAERWISGPPIPGHDVIHVTLWPRTAAGEPDVRIQLEAAGLHVATLLVEAKLGAQKSGMGEVTPDGSSGDQLARYLIAESAQHPNVFLLYLTHHPVVPDGELDESVEQLRKSDRGDLSSRLLWTSWRTVEHLLAASTSETYGRVREVLRRVRMYWFDGMMLTSRGVTLRSNPRFYRPSGSRYVWRPLPRQLISEPWRYGPASSVTGVSRPYRWTRLERHLGSDRFYQRKTT